MGLVAWRWLLGYWQTDAFAAGPLWKTGGWGVAVVDRCRVLFTC